MKNEHDHKKQNSQKTVTQSYRACKMAASCIDLNVNMHYSNNVDTIVHVYIEIYATGCHFTGPIALRHSLSAVLPFMIIVIFYSN